MLRELTGIKNTKTRFQCGRLSAKIDEISTGYILNEKESERENEWGISEYLEEKVQLEDL